MIRLIFLLMLLTVFGCKSKSPSAEVSDRDLTVQVMKKELADELLYNIRIFPGKTLMESKASFSQDMMFHADSCFYLSDGVQKIYPNGVEYVPGGVAKSFEYLVTFEPLRTGMEKDFTLFYQDRYMNKKNYQLRFK